MENDFIVQLKKKLQEPLPGPKAQARMATHLQRLSTKKHPIPKDVRQAAVLILFYQINDAWQLTLMRRSDRGKHSGQVSFPGGRVEKEDAHLVDTALREANEEVGILPSDISVLGKLTALHVPVSNSFVHPFVAYSTSRPRYKIEPAEVKYVIEAPLSGLQDLGKVKHTDMVINDYTLKNVPYFDVGGNVVWGATAMILSELLEIVG